jgi:tryptophan-rich sensory protein
MVFSYTDVPAFIAWVVIVSYQRWNMSDKDTKWYSENAPARLGVLALPSIVFPIVWTILHCLLIASHFSYFHLTIDYNHWTCVTVFVLTMVNLTLAQLWTLLFFKMRMIGAALGVAVGLVVTAIANTVIMGMSTNNIDLGLWGLPFGLYIPYVLWLIFAVVLNLTWTYEGRSQAPASSSSSGKQTRNARQRV